jgi:hypothetical protein
MMARGSDERTLPPGGLIQWLHRDAGHLAGQCWARDGDTRLSSLATVWLVSYVSWQYC